MSNFTLDYKQDTYCLVIHGTFFHKHAYIKKVRNIAHSIFIIKKKTGIHQKRSEILHIALSRSSIIMLYMAWKVVS